MKSRPNFSTLLEDLEKKIPAQNRYDYIVRSIGVMPILLNDYGDRGFGIKLLLETLPTYEERWLLVNLMRHLILTIDDRADVLTTLHHTQHQGFIHTQREYWRSLPCHKANQYSDESDSSSAKSSRSSSRKKRELSNSGLFSAQRGQDQAVVKKVRDNMVLRTYDLRDRSKKK